MDSVLAQGGEWGMGVEGECRGLGARTPRHGEGGIWLAERGEACPMETSGLLCCPLSADPGSAAPEAFPFDEDFSSSSSLSSPSLTPSPTRTSGNSSPSSSTGAAFQVSCRAADGG